jgi:hypothetical protein
MLIDEPDLMNQQRLHMTADALENGETVIVCIEQHLPHEHCYRNWLTQILRERGHTDDGARILACGASFHFEESK